MVWCVVREGITDEDVRYYFRGLHPEQFPPRNPAATGPAFLMEYPDAGLWPVRALDTLTGASLPTFTFGFAVMFALLSGLFLSFILVWGARNSSVGSVAPRSTATEPASGIAPELTGKPTSGVTSESTSGVTSESTAGATPVSGAVSGASSADIPAIAARQSRHYAAGWFWVAFTAAAGPILLTRLDLIPGILVALALALMLKHPRVSAFVLAFATLSKLWPGVLAATMVDKFSVRATWTRLVAFAVSLAGLASITVAMFGTDRLLSPITYQSDRGLQIESILATPFMAARVNDFAGYSVFYAPSKSFEIVGRGTDWATGMSSKLVIGMLVFAVGFALWRFLRDGWTRQSATWFALLLVLLLIVTNKVFSPQYMAWVGPLVALCVVVSSGKITQVIAWLSIIIAALTTVIYPVVYEAIFIHAIGWATGILVARNGLIVLLTILVAVQLARSCRRRALV